MHIIEGDSRIVDEPDWSQVYSDVLDIASAQSSWRELVSALTAAGTLAPENARMMERCVDFRIQYEKAKQQVAEKGMVIPPKRGSKTAIARPSPYWVAMREAASDLDRIEGELGLQPRRRGSVTKVDRKARARQAADAYLKPVSG